MSRILGLNRGRVLSYLNRMIDTLPVMSGCSIDAGFDNKLAVGNAFVHNFDGGGYGIIREQVVKKIQVIVDEFEGLDVKA